MICSTGGSNTLKNPRESNSCSGLGRPLGLLSTEIDIRRGGARTDNIVEGRNEVITEKWE